jgi:hypothetical protein
MVKQSRARRPPTFKEISPAWESVIQLPMLCRPRSYGRCVVRERQWPRAHATCDTGRHCRPTSTPAKASLSRLKLPPGIRAFGDEIGSSGTTWSSLVLRSLWQLRTLLRHVWMLPISCSHLTIDAADHLPPNAATTVIAPPSPSSPSKSPLIGYVSQFRSEPRIVIDHLTLQGRQGVR